MASSARNQVGLPRSSLGCRGGGADRGRGTALGAGRGAPGAGAAAGEEFAAEPVRLMMARASVARCPWLLLFSFFFTLLSLADELLSAAARPVSRTCIGGENSLSASACKTLEPSKKKGVCKSSRGCLPRFTTATSLIT